MSILDNIEEQVIGLQEQNIEPENIHIDFDSLVRLCHEIDMEPPKKGGLINMELLSIPITLSLDNKTIIEVN